MPEVKEPDLALAGLALLIIFGLLIWSERPVESSRPFDPYGQHQDLQTTGYSYESWLWQDPFAFDSISQKKESEFYSVNQRKEFAFYFSNQKKELEGQCEYQLNNLIKHIKEKNPEDAVKILTPLLKVRADTVDIENKELRTRDRYAMIVGLIESGYRPQEPDHLHFCSTQGNKEYDVRWEHFCYESKCQSDTDTLGQNKIGRSDKDVSDDKSNHKPENKPDIIVAWMDSKVFTDNAKFRRILASLFKSEEISKVDFSVYDLNNILDQKRYEELKDAIENKNYKNIQFITPAVDEAALIKKLTYELELRNIKKQSDVMLITEQDSENVRNFARSFRESLCGSLPKPIHANAESRDCEVKNVFYLKGLDAYQQILHKQDKNGSEADKPAARLSAIDLDTPSPLSIGPSQFDYFHRLAKQINDVHKEINLEKRDSGIRAIGIFGSDFYDKLRILEALRAEMPNMLIFTTDLDAQMLHPTYWLSTRNLVVASRFDLMLREEYQKRFPPFRDSQQTNIFFHTISTVTGHVKVPENLSPQIFEVGRNGFVHLTQGKNEDLKYHPPDNSLEQAKKRLTLLAWVIISLIVFYWKIRLHSQEASQGRLWGIGSFISSIPIGLALSILAIFAIAWFFATDKSGEALSFTDGTSLWPSIFIQLIAALLAWGVFPYSAMRHLDENSHHVNRQYFQTNLKDRRRPSGILARAFFSLIIIAITIVIYVLNEVAPSEFEFELCLVLLFLVEFICLLVIRSRKGNSRFKSFRDWVKKVRLAGDFGYQR